MKDNVLESCGLFGSEGELVLLRISISPKLLEDLLDALSQLSFPVNPELYHSPGLVAVEFPAYLLNVAEVQRLLGNGAFDESRLAVSRALAART